MNCPVCGHPVRVHSSEPEIGCLFVVLSSAVTGVPQCPCPLPGTSQADQ